MAMMEAHDNLEEYIQKIEHWRDTALQLSKNLGTAQNKINYLEQDYAVSNRELLILQVEINRLNAELASRINELHYANTVCMEQRHELARRDEELALTEKKLCNIDRLAMEEIARRDEIIKRLKEDGERLATTYVIEVFPHEWVCRGGCHHWARFGEQIEHSPDCPITLHRALMKGLE